MSTCLKPAPVDIRQLGFTSVNSTFTAEISSTRGLGQVWPDSVDEGLTVVGRTGREVVFVVHEVSYDAEGELTHWTLRSLDNLFTMVLFND